MCEGVRVRAKRVIQGMSGMECDGDESVRGVSYERRVIFGSMCHMLFGQIRHTRGLFVTCGLLALRLHRTHHPRAVQMLYGEQILRVAQIPSVARVRDVATREVEP